MPLFTIQLLTYNGQKYLDGAIRSVLNSSLKDFEFLMADNASRDKSFEILREWQKRDRRIKPVIKFSENLGFAGGHNRLLEKGEGGYVLFLNQDTEIDKFFLEKARAILEGNDKIAGLQGKILRLPDKKVIDTTGLLIFKNRRVVNRGQGESDRGQYDKFGEIFGVDGALPVYKRKALKTGTDPVTGSVPVEEVFDESFFAYKEDVDLSWRLRLFGWKFFYSPKIIGYHYRGSGEAAHKNFFKIIGERRKISKFSKFLSFRNQRLMQIKNELPILFIRDFPWIFIKEFFSWFYVIIFEPFTWPAIKSLFKLAPLAYKKRKWIMKKRTVSTQEISKWFK